jgi:hypothetical protein
MAHKKKTTAKFTKKSTAGKNNKMKKKSFGKVKTRKSS